MLSTFLPTTDELEAVFEREVRKLGGRVTDRFDDGERLFVRAVLNDKDEVRRGDTIRSGICMKAVGPEIAVAPYTFRKVCSNGAIHSETIGLRSIDRYESTTLHDNVDEVLVDVANAVSACANPSTFRLVVSQMRRATNRTLDLALALIPFTSQMSPTMQRQFFATIFDEYSRAGDATQYGLMNAITAIARSESDPQKRWDLEELGGGVPALVLPSRSPDRPGRTASVSVDDEVHALSSPCSRESSAW